MKTSHVVEVEQLLYAGTPHLVGNVQAQETHTSEGTGWKKPSDGASVLGSHGNRGEIVFPVFASSR